VEGKIRNIAIISLGVLSLVVSDSSWSINTDDMSTLRNRKKYKPLKSEEVADDSNLQKSMIVNLDHYFRVEKKSLATGDEVFLKLKRIYLENGKNAAKLNARHTFGLTDKLVDEVMEVLSH
jgi:hypothetical protein